MIESTRLFVDYDGTFNDDLKKDNQIFHPVVYCWEIRDISPIRAGHVIPVKIRECPG